MKYFKIYSEQRDCEVECFRSTDSYLIFLRGTQASTFIGSFHDLYLDKKGHVRVAEQLLGHSAVAVPPIRSEMLARSGWQLLGLNSCWGHRTSHCCSGQLAFSYISLHQSNIWNSQISLEVE